MGPCIARIVAAFIAVAPAAVAVAQTTTTALPPQNYGSQPGFFRSAPEMQALSGATAGVPTAAPAAPAPAAPVATPAAPVAVTATPTATVVAVTPERIPDPTQNLQWTERQMDRAENAAQRQQALAPSQVIAPGAYNGQTDPATR